MFKANVWVGFACHVGMRLLCKYIPVHIPAAGSYIYGQAPGQRHTQYKTIVSGTAARGSIQMALAINRVGALLVGTKTKRYLGSTQMRIYLYIYICV